MSSLKSLLIGAAALGLLAAVPACTNIPQPTSTAVSQYSPQSRIIEGFDVSTVTDAPLDIMIIVRLDASPEDVWDLVGDHNRLNDWFPKIASSYILEDEPSTNRDFEFLFTRQCEFDGDILTEDIPFDNGVNAYAYSINADRTNVMVPMSDHLGMFVVEPYGEAGSLLTWRQYWKKGFMGQFAAPYMRGKYMEPAIDSLIERFGGERVSLTEA